MSKAIWTLDATETARLIKTKQLSAREVVEAHLERLNGVNPKLNAVVRILADDARKEADAADKAIKSGANTGPLHGVPITTKINSDQAGCPTDNGVVMFKDLMAREDSPQVGSLRRAGGIVIGRTNSPAFAMRLTTDNALHGQTWNPWDKAITCGGSSGGAGAALATGVGALAQGNDIGGSIRWPAYCNGVVGLRPTIGRVPAHNPTATLPRNFAAQMMSVNGPMARSVRDIRLGLTIMSQRDPRDPTWVPAPLEGPPITQLKAAIAVDKTLPAETLAAMRRAGKHLANAGYVIEEIEPPDLNRVAELWTDIGLTEIGSALNPLLANLNDEGMRKSMGDLWAAKGRSDLGVYMAALRERETLLIKWQQFMETYPIVVLPVSGELQLPYDIDVQGPSALDRTMQSHRYQLMLPVLGLPGLAVPMGTANGWPMGVQLVTRRYREDLILAAGEVIEAQEPPITPIDVKW